MGFEPMVNELPIQLEKKIRKEPVETTRPVVQTIMS
jgi:hypothetical protein